MSSTQELTSNISRWILIIAIFLVLLSLCFEGWFAYVDIGPFPPDNYSLSLAFVLILVYLSYQRWIVLNSFFVVVTSLLVMMILWVGIVDVWSGVGAYTRFHRLGLFGMSFFALTVTYVTARDEGVFRIYLWTVFIAIGISSFVAVMQLLGINLFWNLRLLFGVSSKVIESQLVNQSRPAGLSLFAIQLSYQLSMLLPLSFGLLYSRFGKKEWENKLLYLIVIVFGAGLFATKTRSAIIGALIGCALIILLKDDKKTQNFGMLAMVSTVAVLGVLALPSVRDRFFELSASAFSRVPMTILAFFVARDNPLGVGTGQYDPQPYAEHVRHLPGVVIALSNTPHNQFLNTLVYYGLPGLILLLTLYFVVFKKLVLVSSRDHELGMNRMAIAFLGGYVGYVVNSLFHNAGAFMADPFHWYFIGLTGALVYHSVTGERT